MHDLLIMIAEAIPEEEIVFMLGEALDRYKSDPVEYNREALAASCGLYMTKVRLRKIPAKELADKLTQAKQILDMFKGEKKS